MRVGTNETVRNIRVVDVKGFLQHILEKKQKKSRYFLRKRILAEKPLPE